MLVPPPKSNCSLKDSGGYSFSTFITFTVSPTSGFDNQILSSLRFLPLTSILRIAPIRAFVTSGLHWIPPISFFKVKRLTLRTPNQFDCSAVFQHVRCILDRLAMSLALQVLQPVNRFRQGRYLT